jgi:hypothetical protein
VRQDSIVVVLLKSVNRALPDTNALIIQYHRRSAQMDITPTSALQSALYVLQALIAKNKERRNLSRVQAALTADRDKQCALYVRTGHTVHQDRQLL